MRINTFRKELKAILSAPGPHRAPVLRRSLLDDWLYATDLPSLCGENEKQRFLKEVSANGWETMEAHGWIQLRKPAQEPPEDWYEGAFGPEADCCRSLLERHPGGDDTEAERVQRILIKAAEEGEKALEAACAGLHRSWAEHLRKGEQLPAVHPAYFTARKE